MKEEESIWHQREKTHYREVEMHTQEDNNESTYLRKKRSSVSL